MASPYLWVALAHPDPLGISGRGFELDLANLVVPTRVTAIRPSFLHDLAGRLGGQNLTEQVGYVGPVLPLLAGFALWERRRQPLARVLALTIVAATVIALGTQLVVAGHRTRLPLPWTLVDSLPLASHALTARAFVIAWLALAVVVALFLSRGSRLRWLVFGLLAVTLVPNPERALWVTKLERPALFQDDRWRSVVRPGENVLNIPFGFEGRAMLWQEEAGFAFRMTGGYVSATQPDSVWRYPIVRSFFGAPLPPFPAQDLRALASARQADVVLMPRTYPAPWPGIASEAFGKPRAVGGMLAWRVRGSWPRSLGSLR